MSDALRIATPVADAPRPVTLTQRASLNVIASATGVAIRSASAKIGRAHV